MHGNYYGTSVAGVEKVIAEGKICILDIDVQVDYATIMFVCVCVCLFVCVCRSRESQDSGVVACADDTHLQ